MKTAKFAREISILIERAQNDSYWGARGDRSGGNIPGKLFIKVRDELRNQ